MSPFVLPPFVLSTTVALREASGVAPNRGHSAMKVRADRETWSISRAVRRVRHRLLAEIDFDFYR